MHYHTSCYTKHKNDARRSRLMLRDALQLDAAMILLVIAQLVAFVENNHSTFKLADLRKLYDRRLNQLFSDWIGVSLRAPEKIQRTYIREARTGLVGILRGS